MSNLSNNIEKFIIASMGTEDYVEISRNSLAEYFACARSQINYVLDTRFTLDRGYAKESKRGGGGFIKISKLKTLDEHAYINNLVLESIGDELTFKRMTQILEKLLNDNILSGQEKDIVLSALSEDSLAMPFAIKDRIRAKAFKNILINLMKK